MQRAGIVGYRGYSGAELVRLLERHPHVAPVLLEHRETGDAPSLRRPKSHTSGELGPQIVEKEQLAVVFLATPPEVSMELAPGLLASGARVVDLSGAFRLGSAEKYTAWYKAPHTAPDLLAEAVYGLPEFCRERVRGARLL